LWRPVRNLVMNGDFEGWMAGTAVAPSCWTLVGAGAAVAREATIIDRFTYSAKLTAALNTITYLQQTVPWSVHYKGSSISVGCRVHADDAQRVCLVLYDGVGSTFGGMHTGGSAFEWLTVTRTLDANATELTVRLYIVSGASIIAYFDGVTMVECIIPPPIPLAHYGDKCYLIGPHKNNATSYPVLADVTIQTGVTASSSGDKAITFPTAFSVVLGALCSGAGDNSYYVKTLATSGFTAARHDGAASDTVYWIAWGII
jgi:hypothetical protein